MIPAIKSSTTVCLVLLLAIAVSFFLGLVNIPEPPHDDSTEMAPKAPDSRRVAEIMLSWLGLSLGSMVELQTLWAGYGHICAVEARAADEAAAAHMRGLLGLAAGEPHDGVFRLVLKVISPPRSASSGDEGHWRKMLSYEVEQYFYDEVAPVLGRDAPVAACVASTRGGVRGRPGDAAELAGVTATLMADLRPRYPVAGGRRGTLDAAQVAAALRWLARFHAKTRPLVDGGALDRGFVLPPLQEVERRRQRRRRDEDEDDKADGHGVWLNGGYTYLATRRSEYESLARARGSEWAEALCRPQDGQGRSVAEQAAAVLTPSGRRYETLVHGDVKSENLFTNAAGDEVAFYDFQYVGAGLGVCDLAKLFTCSVPLDMLLDDDDDDEDENNNNKNKAFDLHLDMGAGERRLLSKYHDTLGMNGYDWELFVRHWETALVDWCRFQASWGFWGNTEWLEARVRSILGSTAWRQWIDEQLQNI